MGNKSLDYLRSKFGLNNPSNELEGNEYLHKPKNTTISPFGDDTEMKLKKNKKGSSENNSDEYFDDMWDDEWAAFTDDDDVIIVNYDDDDSETIEESQ